jgi:hypothetical protein
MTTETQLLREALLALNSFPHRHLTPTITGVRDDIRRHLSHPTAAEQPQTPLLTKMQISDMWIQRDCMKAIQEGDLLTQLECLVHAVERYYGIQRPETKQD